MNFERLSSLGINSLCIVFVSALSKIRIIDGRMVTQAITPMTTPLAITMPISRPSL